MGHCIIHPFSVPVKLCHIVTDTEWMSRPRVDWMTRADDAILEFLQNQGNQPLRASPSVMEANVGYEISHVRARVRKLQEEGLIEYFDKSRGIYQISSKGGNISMGI